MVKTFNILVADDDADIWATSLEAHLQDLSNIEISSVYTPDACREALGQNTYAIILVDISFAPNDLSGLALVPEIQVRQPDTKIFMLSNHDDDVTMVKSIKAGALDFISKKSAGVPGMANTIRDYISGLSRRESDEATGQEIAARIGAVAASKAMIGIFTEIAKARRNPQTPVLITGETGAGKEVIASAIAYNEEKKPLVTVDCGAISETLAESELFGHAKGAFTGADSAKPGKFQSADNGYLFLDEIGNLKRSIQEKILRALQTKEITPVGSNKPIKVNVRIIAATNESLNQLVKEGRFRQDLLERLKGNWIRIPPLRSRPEDVEALIEKFIKGSDKPHLVVTPNCFSLLKRYSWPGNVRELEKVVNEMIANADDGPLTLRHFPEHFADSLADDLRIDESDSGAEASSIDVSLPLKGSLADAESAFLVRYLTARFQMLGPDPSQAKLARDLRISRTTLRSHLRRQNIDLGDTTE